MRQRLCILTIALLLAGAGNAAASLVEDATGVHYQNDGDQGHDAPDVCGGQDLPPLTVPGEGAGQLVPVDDQQDHWVLSVEDADVGSEVALGFHGHHHLPVGGSLGLALEVLVRAPGCGDVVADALVPLGEDATLVFIPSLAGAYDVGIALVEDPHEGEAVLPGMAVPMGYHCEPFCAFDYGLAVVH